MLKLYYKSVNRGLSFTKPGIYTIGYVMTIGLLAIITGINGFYIFMSTGLALLIVSGLISERVMRNNKVTHLESVVADSKKPFNLNFTVNNSSPSFTTFGIETSFTLDKPDFHLIAKPTQAPIAGKALKIAPQMSSTFHAKCGGLPRGQHQKVYVTQKTNYPFGFLEKFKIIELPCSLVITPEIDESLYNELSADLTRRKALAESNREFFSHQPYTHKEPLKHIDWKRSAGKPPKDWVVKQFRSEVQNFHFKILSPWQHAIETSSEEQYELYLSRMATALKALSNGQVKIGFDTKSAPIIWNENHIQEALASAPRFEQRNQGLTGMPSTEAPAGACVTLLITLDSYSWVNETAREVG